MLKRLARAALGLVGLEAVRLPGYERRLLFMDQRTRREFGPALLLHDHLAMLFDRYGVDCVLDVGANRGQYGHELRNAGYRGRLWSFEPVEQLYKELEQESAGDPAWTAHRLALGRETGAHEINVTRHDVFSSFREPIAFAAERFGDSTEVARHERVAVRRLDDVLDELCAGGAPPRCFLKMDTQGYDLEVFAGLGRWAQHVVGLQSEVAAMPLYAGMPRMAEAIAQYEAAGFELTGLFPLSRDEPTGRVIEFDCVMVRAAARLAAWAPGVSPDGSKR